MTVERWMGSEISGRCGMMRRQEMLRCWKRLQRKILMMTGGVRVRRKKETVPNRRAVEGRERLGRGSRLQTARDRLRQA